MALSSSQIYVANYSTSPEQATPTSSVRTRARESTSTSRWRFGRSTTNLRESESPLPSSAGQKASFGPDSSPPPSVPKLERSASKVSLFNLFSRPMAERARGHTEVGLAAPMRPQPLPKPSAAASAPKSSLRHNPSPPAQQTIRARTSQIFRPNSMKPGPPSKDFGTWEPPPLFQAFPQSIKHATVQSCVFAPELLLRTQSQRRQAELLRERINSVRDLSMISEDGAEAKRLERTHRRLITNSALQPPVPELLNKIYILVAAGYVLQYAGDGSLDRTPEKVLKLGKDSAAFACDLIPGKHWVLQISSHALDDGTIEAGPRNSLLSRIRSHNSTTKKAATSFLLVLESGEEMDAWMTAVRKEIDNQCGTKVKDEASRASSSTDDTRDSNSSDITGTSHRYMVQQDPKVPSKILPIDSPLQSQYGSPQTVTSDWASNRSERTMSITESCSGQSCRHETQRQSIEASSIATMPVSQDQLQPVSNSTALSGPGTSSTSRESSPAPQSPLHPGNFPVVESEPPRSAMSLRSFHMKPNASVASRRRSMQPLPVTDEHSAPSANRSAPWQRHSLYAPVSPTMADVARLKPTDSGLSIKESVMLRTMETREYASLPSTKDARPTHSQAEPKLDVQAPIQPPVREDICTQSSAHSYNIPPQRDVVSPPPKELVLLPPVSASRQSIIAASPNAAMAAPNGPSPPPDVRAQRRGSANPKPFLRPFPVRPQQQHTDKLKGASRRLSSTTPSSGPATFLLSVNVHRSVTAPASPPSVSVNSGPTSHPRSFSMIGQGEVKLLQTRTSPAPYLLSTSRPVRAVVSTPSFVPSRRTSNPQAASSELTSTQSPRSNSASMGAQPQLQVEHKFVAPRWSIAAIDLPPPVPPPNMPLPNLPPSMPLPSTPHNTSLSTPQSQSDMPLPGPPPNVPLPALPPNTPLPPTPPQMQLGKDLIV
ncbi:hypothetical protein BDU57DRAFT_458221 [Ampelomyces quisqualis]|uniref:PH domain-containing protein n=1 Tax=Ampelomyces quisqualis TaxID=50730 RepID=A0A6A5QBX6_AMPQU|nr:hypothetical protein BDU57DRAFT_458221 [Ampelomyces quisqualis]